MWGLIQGIKCPRASNKALLIEEDQWLTDMTAVYNDKLSSAILPEIERGMTVISDKSSLMIKTESLIRSARRAEIKKINRTKGEVSREVPILPGEL